MNNGQNPAPTRLTRDRAWLRDRVVVDGGSLAIEEGRRWADALGLELVICRRRPGEAAGGRVVEVPRTFMPARVQARLVVVEASAGHIRWRSRRTRSPLLVARPPSRKGRILVAVDLADPDESVLELVARQKADVTLIYTIEQGLHEAEWMANFGGASYDFVPNDVEARRSDAEQRLSELLARHSLRGDVRVGQTRVVPFILNVAAELEPELIAIGAPRVFPAVLRRTTADQVAASATQSVLVVPHRHSPHS